MAQHRFEQWEIEIIRNLSMTGTRLIIDIQKYTAIKQTFETYADLFRMGGLRNCLQICRMKVSRILSDSTIVRSPWKVVSNRDNSASVILRVETSLRLAAAIHLRLFTRNGIKGRSSELLRLMTFYCNTFSITHYGVYTVRLSSQMTASVRCRYPLPCSY